MYRINNLKILFWNSQSMNNKEEQLISLTNKFNPEIICLNETWFNPNRNYKFHPYNIIRNDREDGYGGTAILIKNKINVITNVSKNYTNGPKDSTLQIQMITIEITENNKPYELYIINTYSSNQKTDMTKLTEFIRLNNVKTDRLIMLGDFNSKHLSWGCHTEDRNGETLYDLCESNNLLIHNTLQFIPTRLTSPQNNNSYTDLTISSMDLSLQINYNILDDTYGSDHFPSITELNASYSHSTEYLIDDNPSKEIKIDNWKSFNRELSKKLKTYTNPDYDIFYTSQIGRASCRERV